MDFFEEDNPVFNFFHGLYEEISNMGWDVVSYVGIAVAAWMFLKVFHIFFALPRRMNKQLDIQQMLQDKITDYEKYLEEQKAKEIAAGINPNEPPPPEAGKTGLNGTAPDNNQSYEEKWKERQEFLDMLKKELKRVRDGGDPYDWGNLLDDEENENDKINDPNTPSTSTATTSENIDMNATENAENKQVEYVKDNLDKKED